MRKLLIAGLVAAVAVPVLAQPAAPQRPAADKVMIKADVDTRVRARFARVDANRDGVLTTQEMTAQRAERVAKRTAGRAARNPDAAFNRFDANRDGMISRDEFAQVRATRAEKRAEKRGQPGAQRRMNRQGGGMMSGAMLRMADANRDGQVTLQEATAGAARHFDMIDTDRDGRITREERRAGRAMMKRMRARQAG